MNNWYVANIGNDHQGLVIEEGTGRNVAVAYDKADATLLASAPEMLQALEALLWQWDNNDKQLCGMALQDARAAVNNVKGK
jgi:adenine-specific DNA methylase